MAKKRVLVSGAAGFLGSHLCEALIADGNNVVGVDNLCTGNLENLNGLEREPKFEFIEHDICDALKTDGLGYVFNFASPASPYDYARLGPETLKVGSYGTINMLDVARSCGAKFLHASTSECYGDPDVHPQPETYWGHVNPIGPRSVYDESKRFSEAVVMAYHRYYGVDTHMVRIFNTYGPRLQPTDGRVISNLMMQALRGEALTVFGDGSQTRSFCYVSDLIDGIMRLSRSEEHLPVNIGNPEEWTILECAQEVQAVTGSKSKIRYESLPEDDPTRRKPDITKAKELLGWSPKVSLREGLKLSLSYFEKRVKETPASRV
ncbi:MAG TPA: UDP-glucuronic acid decarboxylase family protein [Acidobacteriaceae bacterium]|nr:UDP-glucuronic acid decarboxylase family protein [Acidobacteriaceae bacterium]